jgi:penicillin-binding protein 1A
MDGEAEPGGMPERRGWLARRSLRVRFMVRATIFGTTLVGILLATAMIRYTIRFPDPASLRQREQAPVVRVLARDGSILVERGRTARAVAIGDLPPHVLHAVIAIEDRRFFSHIGLDFRGLTRAMLSNLRAARYAQGGSTLTQQLAKNLFLTSDRTLERKIEEVVLALWLELRLGKPGILELYLNRVYFGAGVYGIEAAAQRYFAKPARALSVPEAAIIAGLLKAPSRLSPASRPEAAAARAILVLDAMREAGFLSDEQHHAAMNQQVTYAAAETTREETGLEFAVDYILDRLPPIAAHGQAGIIVETTIDARLQKHTQAAVARRLGDINGGEETEAAVVVLDRDGGIRTLVGGRSWAKSQFNRAVRARRQPGSAFKPVVYLTAVEAGVSPDATVVDRPITIGDWSPRNDRGTYAGAMTVRQALAQSVNTIAVSLQQEVGLKRVVATARKLGITSVLREDASLALGTSEVTLMELTGAYGVFSTGGTSLSPHVIRRVRTDRDAVLYARPAPRAIEVATPAHVGRMNDMLHNALVAGTGRRAQFARHSAGGKTGTTQDNRDAWFVGFTGHLTAGVWIGNDDGKPMNAITGGGVPAMLWRDIMSEAHRGLEPVPLPGLPDAPAGATPSSPSIPSPPLEQPAPVAAKPTPQPLRPLSSIDPSLFADAKSQPSPTNPAPQGTSLDTRRLEVILRGP